MPVDSASNHRYRKLWRPVILLVAVGGALIASKWMGAAEGIAELQDWIASHGPWAPVVFIGIYTGTTLVAIPGIVLTLVAGVLFGAIVGIVIVSIASTLGAILSFVIARYVARDAVASLMKRSRRFHRLENQVRRHGAVIVAVTRLVPVLPFALLNYGFGLTAVPFWTYTFWTWVCMLPGTAVYVVGIAAIAEIVTHGRIPWEMLGLLAIMAVVLYVLMRLAIRHIDTSDNGPDEGPRDAQAPSSG